MSIPTSEELKWMSHAMVLAEKGRLNTSPNPMVGACVVKKGKLIASGYHEAYGKPHAEIEALKHAGRKVRGGSLYVTLEPCSTWGKTPPCVGAILQSGVKEIIVGALDPNPKHQGEGIRILRKNGFLVRTGILADEIQEQNEAFFKRMRTGFPFVTVKMAQSLDGKIATCRGLSRWISSPASRKFVHELRLDQDAILIGKNTLLKDNPLLSPRIKGAHNRPDKPWRVVLDPDLEISGRARIFQGKQLTLIVTSKKQLNRLGRMKHHSGRIYLAVPEKKGRLDLIFLMKQLAQLGISKVLVEGGGELVWSLLEEKLADKIYWIMAPKFIGGRQAKTSVEGDGVEKPDDAFPVEVTYVSRLGEDWLFEGKL